MKTPEQLMDWVEERARSFEKLLQKESLDELQWMQSRFILPWEFAE